MSKVDALRALREAKYAADRAAAPTGTAGTGRKAAAVRPSVAQATRSSATPHPEPAGTELAATETEARCGHRNMGGKSCTRPENHSEKNHRYS